MISRRLFHAERLMRFIVAVTAMPGWSRTKSRECVNTLSPVDGAPSKNFEMTKSLMYGQPQLWDALMTRLADITISFLRVQVAAGASAVQLFDSWVGALSPEDYRRSVLPHSARVFAALAETGVPRIHFGVGTGELLALLTARLENDSELRAAVHGWLQAQARRPENVADSDWLRFEQEKHERLLAAV